MDLFEIFTKAWPILLGIVGLIVVLSKLDHKVVILEEKVKQLFTLWNERKK